MISSPSTSSRSYSSPPWSLVRSQHRLVEAAGGRHVGDRDHRLRPDRGHRDATSCYASSRDGRDRQRRDPLLAADEPHPLPRVALTLTWPRSSPSAPASRPRIASRTGASLGRSSTTVASTCDDVSPASASSATRRAQQLDRVRARVARVGVGEVLADVAERAGAEHRVDDRVGEHVGVGVAVQAAVVLDLRPRRAPAPVRRRSGGSHSRSRWLMRPRARDEQQLGDAQILARGDLQVARVGADDRARRRRSRSTSQASSVARASSSSEHASARSSAARRNT